MLHILFCADNEPDGFVPARRPIWRMSDIEQQRCEMQGQRSSGGSQNQTMSKMGSCLAEDRGVYAQRILPCLPH